MSLFRPDFRNESNEMNQRCSLSTHDHDSVNVIRQVNSVYSSYVFGIFHD